MLAGAFFLVKPPPGAADGGALIFIAVVVQKIQVFKAVFLAESLELCRRAPPVIVIPLENDLPSGDGVDPRKIRLRAGQVQRPAQIPQQNRGILRPDDGQAVSELVHVTNPCAAENVHGLRCAQTKMQVADGVQSHGTPP